MSYLCECSEIVSTVHFFQEVFFLIKNKLLNSFPLKYDTTIITTQWPDFEDFLL